MLERNNQQNFGLKKKIYIYIYIYTWVKLLTGKVKIFQLHLCRLTIFLPNDMIKIEYFHTFACSGFGKPLEVLKHESSYQQLDTYLSQK